MTEDLRTTIGHFLKTLKPLQRMEFKRIVKLLVKEIKIKNAGNPTRTDGGVRK